MGRDRGQLTAALQGGRFRRREGLVHSEALRCQGLGRPGQRKAEPLAAHLWARGMWFEAERGL